MTLGMRQCTDHLIFTKRTAREAQIIMDDDQRRSVLLSIIGLSTMLVYQDMDHNLSDDYVDFVIAVSVNSRKALDEIIDSSGNEINEPEFTSGDGLSPETFKTIEA